MAPASLARPSVGDLVSNPPAQSPNINFRHPGYKDGYNQLLILPALDNGGIHYETALIACAILANNHWHGWFTEEQEGDRVNVPNDGILRKQNYYFRVSDCASDLWQSFNIPSDPADRPLPRQSSTIQALFSRDISCRITKYVEGTECVHLVPKSDITWFEQNNMASYGKPSRADAEFIDDARNAILLRSDVHKFFDDKRLAFVVKPSATPPSTTTLVVHIFIPGSTSELTGLYHNRSLQPLTGISVEYLFARFAWTIFDFLKPFLQQGQKRWISLYNADTSETCTREAAGEEIRQLTLRSKSRSASPRKRKPPVDYDDGENIDEGLEHEWVGEEIRGRWRKHSVASKLSIEPSSSFSSSFGSAGQRYISNSEAESDSNTDVSFPEVQFKKQRMSKACHGSTSLQVE